MEHVTPPSTLDSDAISAGTPVLDFEHYRASVEGDFENADAADQFLQSLWHIMCVFVELGLDVKSSTANLPFMRELSSEFERAAPQSEHPERQTEERARDCAQKDDS